MYVEEVSSGNVGRNAIRDCIKSVAPVGDSVVGPINVGFPAPSNVGRVTPKGIASPILETQILQIRSVLINHHWPSFDIGDADTLDVGICDGKLFD